jgi:hypothetical protein
MRLLRRWIQKRAGDRHDGLELRELTEEVEAGLRDIGFDEVTIEDRATFVEHAVIWQVRRALRVGQFDLALALQRFGVERIAQLHASAPSVDADPPRIFPIHPPPSERATRPGSATR